MDEDPSVISDTTEEVLAPLETVDEDPTIKELFENTTVLVGETVVMLVPDGLEETSVFKETVDNDTPVVSDAAEEIMAPLENVDEGPRVLELFVYM